MIAFFDAVGTIPWTRSIRESKENCFPDIRIPRILLLIALKIQMKNNIIALINYFKDTSNTIFTRAVFHFTSQ